MKRPILIITYALIIFSMVLGCAKADPVPGKKPEVPGQAAPEKPSVGPAAAEPSLDPLAGSWSGTVQSSDKTLTISFNINQGCRLNAKCGDFFIPEFDLGGPYWDSPRPESYDLFSPHRFVQNWDTPMLIIGGQLDFRVPVTESMQAFTALRAQGIDGRFLYFPEEGHWILSPQNGLLWHREFFGWLDRYLKPPSS